MAAKKAKESKAAKRGSYYKVDGEKVTTDMKYCPRCGPGIMMAGHKDRASCGKCGYTEFKK